MLVWFRECPPLEDPTLFMSNSEKPDYSYKKWQRICTHKRKEIKNCGPNFENFEKIKFYIYLKPFTIGFFAIHSSKMGTSNKHHS